MRLRASVQAGGRDQGSEKGRNHTGILLALDGQATVTQAHQAGHFCLSLEKS